ncbi:sn1-specific diacylglycerol lipase beta [Ditylenchus destructor]|nr:sn1-specific diacylglycerol lipase beta [Ditylenchus destructor]
MPSLVAFGRRWNISSDDFVFPELTEALVRIGWIVGALVLFFLHSPFTCTSSNWLIYMAVMISLNLISAVFCISISILSARGSILDTNTRKHVTTLIYIRVPIFVAEFLWTISSTILIFGVFNTDYCFTIFGIPSELVFLLMEWLLITMVCLGIIIVFNPQGGQSVEESITIERRYWRKRLCKLRQDQTMRMALDEVACMIASFFVDNDFVFSDIVAGLLLLVHSPHRNVPTEGQDAIEKTSAKPEYWMKTPECLKTASRMLDFAVAIYGWPTYLLNNCACMPWYRLCKQLKICKKCINNDIIVVEDNCFSCHTSAFVLESVCNETDIFFASFRNALYQVPFVVLTDHETKSIVIAIRGSASLLDLVTDLSLSDDIFSVDVDDDPVLRQDRELDGKGEVRVHRGMMRGARYVYDILKEHNVIEDMQVLNPGYTVVVCAGVATILTLLLKQTYEDIRCYAFSPPGCVISENGLEETKAHVLSIFIGDDFICRTSFQSIMTLKDQIEREIFSTNKAKYEILIKGFFKLFFASAWDLHSTSDSETPAANRDNRRLIEHRETEFGYGTAGSVTVENGQINGRSNNEEQHRVRLYPPGQLLRLAIVDDHVERKWVTHEYLSEIQLTATTILDHLPYRVRKIVKRALEEANVQ